MDERLQALLDYTIFHIGVYLALGTAVIAAGDWLWKFHSRILIVVLVLMLIAGAAGGAVASNIPTAQRGILMETFLVEKPFLFFGWKSWFSNGTLTQIEHGAFWIALLVISVYFIFVHAKGQLLFRRQ